MGGERLKFAKIFGTMIGLAMMLTVIGGCATSNQATVAPPPQVMELNVSAALGLKEVLLDIQKNYAALQPNVKIVYNFAAAGALQAQIEQGAPADVFLSAAVKQMDELQKKNLIKSETRKNLVGNQLVLVVPRDSTLNLKDFKDLTLPGVQHFGLGAPETVPAGEYGVEVLKSLGVWEAVKGKAVLGKDVRTLLVYAETGNAEASIVFSTVAATSDKIRLVATAPPGSHRPIIFPGVVLSGSKQPKAAEEFLNYLASPEGMKVFEKYGFNPLTKQ
jgi:molybdate transport system substrate-binding protein